MAELAAKLVHMETNNATGPFFLSEKFSLVDGATARLFVRLAYFQKLLPVIEPARFRELTDWIATLYDLSAVKRTLSLLKPA